MNRLRALLFTAQKSNTPYRYANEACLDCHQINSASPLVIQQRLTSALSGERRHEMSLGIDQLPPQIAISRQDDNGIPSAVRVGLHWFYSRIPNLDIELSMELRGVARDLVVDLS